MTDNLNRKIFLNMKATAEGCPYITNIDINGDGGCYSFGCRIGSGCRLAFGIRKIEDIGFINGSVKTGEMNDDEIDRICSELIQDYPTIKYSIWVEKKVVFREIVPVTKGNFDENNQYVFQRFSDFVELITTFSKKIGSGDTVLLNYMDYVRHTNRLPTPEPVKIQEGFIKEKAEDNINIVPYTHLSKENGSQTKFSHIECSINEDSSLHKNPIDSASAEDIKNEFPDFEEENDLYAGEPISVSDFDTGISEISEGETILSGSVPDDYTNEDEDDGEEFSGIISDDESEELSVSPDENMENGSLKGAEAHSFPEPEKPENNPLKGDEIKGGKGASNMGNIYTEATAIEDAISEIQESSQECAERKREYNKNYRHAEKNVPETLRKKTEDRGHPADEAEKTKIKLEEEREKIRQRDIRIKKEMEEKKEPPVSEKNEGNKKDDNTGRKNFRGNGNEPFKKNERIGQEEAGDEQKKDNGTQEKGYDKKENSVKNEREKKDDRREKLRNRQRENQNIRQRQNQNQNQDQKTEIKNNIFASYEKDLRALEEKYHVQIQDFSDDELLKIVEDRYNFSEDSLARVPDYIRERICGCAKDELRNRLSKK